MPKTILGVPENISDKLKAIYQMLLCLDYAYPSVVPENMDTLLRAVETIVGISNPPNPGESFAIPPNFKERLETLYLTMTGEAYPTVLPIPEGYEELLDSLIVQGATCESFYAYTKVDPNSHIAIIPAMCTVSYSCFSNENAFLYKDAGAGYFENFTHTIRTICSSLDENGSFFVWFSSNQNAKNAKAHFDAGDPCIGVRFIKNGPHIWNLELELFAVDGVGSTVSDTTPPGSPPFDIQFNTEYWLEITRFAGVVTCTIYGTEAKIVPLDVLTIAIPDWGANPNWIFRYLYVCQTWNNGNALEGVGVNGPISGKVTPCG